MELGGSVGAKGLVRTRIDIGADSSGLHPRAMEFAIEGEVESTIITLGVVSLKGGGRIRFIAGIDEAGKEKFYLELTSVGTINLGILERVLDINATMHRGFFLIVGDRIEPGIIVSLDGQIRLLSGLIGAKFGFEASGRISDVQVDPGDPLESFFEVAAQASAYFSVQAAYFLKKEWREQVDCRFRISAKEVGAAVLSPVLLLA